MIIKDNKNNKKLTTTMTLGTMLTPCMLGIQSTVFADESKPTENVTVKPVDNKPATNQPVDNKPVTNKPVDNKPVTNKPVDNKPATNNPVDNKPATNQPVDNKPVTNKPVDNKPATNQPVDNKVKHSYVYTVIVKDKDTGKMIKEDKITFTETDKENIYSVKDNAGLFNGTTIEAKDGQFSLNDLFKFKGSQLIEESFNKWIFGIGTDGKPTYQVPGLKSDGVPVNEQGVYDPDAKTLTFTVEKAKDDENESSTDNTTKPEGTQNTPTATGDKEDKPTKTPTDNKTDKPATVTPSKDNANKSDTNKDNANKQTDNKETKPAISNVSNKPTDNKQTTKDNNGLTLKDYQDAKNKIEQIKNKYKDKNDNVSKWLTSLCDSILNELNTNIKCLQDGNEALYTKDNFNGLIHELNDFMNTELGKKATPEENKDLNTIKNTLLDLVNGKNTNDTNNNSKNSNTVTTDKGTADNGINNNGTNANDANDNGTTSQEEKGVASDKTTTTNEALPDGSHTTTENIGGNDLIATNDTRGNTSTLGLVASTLIGVTMTSGALLLKRKLS